MKTLARGPAIVIELAGGRRRADELAALMRTHGLVQIALRDRHRDHNLRAAGMLFRGGVPDPHLVDRLPFGEAVRRARLALLADSNPLGLVYIPYVQTGLHIA